MVKTELVSKLSRPFFRCKVGFWVDLLPGAFDESLHQVGYSLKLPRAQSRQPLLQARKVCIHTIELTADDPAGALARLRVDSY